MRSILIFILLLPACGTTATPRSSRVTTQPRPPTVVAVLTVTAATETRPLAAEVHARIVRVLRSRRGLRVVDPLPRSDAPVESTDNESCADDVDCLRRLGRAVGARGIVTVRLAELGRTLALRISLVDARRGTDEASMQRIVTPATRERVSSAVDVMARDIAERLSPTPRSPESSGAPWWTWPAIASGIAVAAGVTAFAIVGASDGNDPEDDGIVDIDPP